MQEGVSDVSAGLYAGKLEVETEEAEVFAEDEDGEYPVGHGRAKRKLSLFVCSVAVYLINSLNCTETHCSTDRLRLGETEP